ncbi:MAG: ribonuclease Z [Bacteroidales bacterium]|nr:ribonuclease Z [Bacteroidales bacterium]
MNFFVTILGSGAAAPAHGRNCSGQIVNVNGCHMLVDCGEGTQLQFRICHQKLQSVSAIFISHLHGDHVFGLPGLLASMHLHGRTAPIDVFAPTGLRNMLSVVFEATGTHLQYELCVHELSISNPEQVFSHARCRVTAFPLVHTVPALGYLFEEEQPLLNMRKEVREQYNLTPSQCMNLKRGEDLVLPGGVCIPNAQLTLPPRHKCSYAYCCDTAYAESILPAIKGVDLLCVESTFDDDQLALAQEKCHLTASQAARMALHAHAGSLLLTHFSARYKDVQPLLGAARAIFPNTLAAEDGMAIEVKPPISNL